MNKNRILIGSVVALLIFNLTTIGTILYNKYRDGNETKSITLNSENNNQLNCRYFRQKVGFDQKQMEVFRTANMEFRPKANQIIQQIDALKNQMFTELKKDKSDTLRLDRLSIETGNLHAQLKKETNRFYLKIKTVCTPKQLQQLQSSFTPLFCKGSCGEKGMDCQSKGGKCETSTK